MRALLDARPAPIHTTVYRGMVDADESIVIRHWEPESAACCGRCPECIAYLATPDDRGRLDVAGRFTGDPRPIAICVHYVPTDQVVGFIFG